MEKYQNKGAGMEDELKGSSPSSMLSTSIVDKFKKEFEKSGMLKFTPELEGKLTKCLDETFVENQLNNASFLPKEGGSSMPLSGQSAEQATLPPLVFQFEGPKYGNVILSMLRNGTPKILKNEKGSKRTPALAGFRYTGDTGLIYGTDAKRNDGSGAVVCECINLMHPVLTNQPDRYYYSIDLNELGLFHVPGLFFPAFLIRKLKTTVEAQCNGGLCQLTILAVPMLTKSAQRLRIKEAAVFAGFKDVYLITAEGLAAYYWFHEKEAEIDQKNYSKEFVIIDLFGHAVVYKKSFETDMDGKKILVVTATILLNLFSQTNKNKADFRELVQNKLKIHQNSAVIPVIRRMEDISSVCYLGTKYKANIVVVNDAEVKYFAGKGAALLSETPEKLGRQIRNMIGTTTTVVLVPGKEVTQPDRVLPEDSVRLTFNKRHGTSLYRIAQVEKIGVQKDEETIGYLAVNGVKYGTKLVVTYELSWEGIWKVVGVAAKNSLEDEEGYQEVKWSWLVGDEMDFERFGCNSYEECKALLVKVVPSPSQANVASTEEKRKKRSTKLRVTRPNDGIVNKNLKKIKLESDRVEPVVKIERDLMEEGGNGQQVNLE